MVDDNCQTIIREPVPDNTCHLPMLSDLRDISPLYKESVQPWGSSNRSKQIPTMYHMSYDYPYAFLY